MKILGTEELAWFIYFAGNTTPLLRPGKCLLRCIAFFPTSVPSHPPLLIPIPDFPLCSTPSPPPSPGSDNSCWNDHISISFLFLTNISASWICFYLSFDLMKAGVSIQCAGSPRAGRWAMSARGVRGKARRGRKATGWMPWSLPWGVFRSTWS